MLICFDFGGRGSSRVSSGYGLNGSQTEDIGSNCCFHPTAACMVDCGFLSDWAWAAL